MSSDIAQMIGGSDVVLDSEKWQSPDGDAD